MRTKEEVEEIIEYFKKRSSGTPEEAYWVKYVLQLLNWFLGDAETDEKERIQYELSKMDALKNMSNLCELDVEKIMEYMGLDYDQNL
jgi:hypothetical protein